MTVYYTYLIGWTEHNKWYYGVRFAKNCHPNELWKTYFTSSKHVISFRNTFGEPDIINVRKTFKDVNDDVKIKMSVSAKARKLKEFGKIQTPLGIFETLKDAAYKENISYNKMRNKVIDDNNLDYRRVV